MTISLTPIYNLTFRFDFLALKGPPFPELYLLNTTDPTVVVLANIDPRLRYQGSSAFYPDPNYLTYLFNFGIGWESV